MRNMIEIQHGSPDRQMQPTERRLHSYLRVMAFYSASEVIVTYDPKRYKIGMFAIFPDDIKFSDAPRYVNTREASLSLQETLLPTIEGVALLNEHDLPEYREKWEKDGKAEYVIDMEEYRKENSIPTWS